MRVTRSGDASGMLANSGVIIGDVNLRSGVPVRTMYRHQVERIAPEELVDREAELAELAEFASSPGHAGEYRWWRAGPWAGKTALMATFVLHPPPAVRVVSFFVTARLAGQSDRDAFLHNVLEQLLTILGEELPPLLTPSTIEAHILGLLEESALACQERGETLLLLVDGLDEDRGVTTGPDAHSIAGFLPAKPKAGMRVLVAGRPDPPIPGDVASHHPLRDPGIVRVLTPSPAAQAQREVMEAEVDRLLQGTPAEQDLLGLVTAAGGGLTADDLAELTGWTPRQVDRHLRSVAGRSFTRRDSHLAPDSRPEVYILGHETLQQTALDLLGRARVHAYRDRLHTWADHYRTRGWPADTPEYLLRGYHTLLVTIDDLDRATALGTDQSRHHRLVTITGGDSTAIAQISATIDHYAARRPPDLSAMARLAVHRDHLIYRNTQVPSGLPALWAQLGHLRRALAVADSITDPSIKSLALSELAAALSAADEATARDVVNEALATARTVWAPLDEITAVVQAALVMVDAGRTGEAEAVIETAFAHPGAASWRDLDDVRTQVVEAFGRVGLLDTAVSLSRSVDNVGARCACLAATARQLAGAGRGDSASNVLNEAFATAISIDDLPEQVPALASISAAHAATGDSTRADELNEKIISLTREISDPEDRLFVLAEVASRFDQREWPHQLARLFQESCPAAKPEVRATTLSLVAFAAVTTGNHRKATVLIDNALEIINQFDEADLLQFNEQYHLLLAIGVVLAKIERFDEAIAFAHKISPFREQSHFLVFLAQMLAETGDHERARGLADEATAMARTDVDYTQDVSTQMRAVAKRLTRRGKYPDAVTVATATLRAHHVVEICDVLTDQHQIDLAIALARAITEPKGRIEALVDIANTLTGTGRQADARDMLAEAVDLVRDLDEADEQCRHLGVLVQALRKSGREDAAHALVAEMLTTARALVDPRSRCSSVRLVFDGLVKAGHFRKFTALIEEALTAAADIADVEVRSWELAYLVETLIAAEHVDRAATIAGTIPDTNIRTRSLSRVVRSAIKTGRYADAITIARSTDPEQGPILRVVVDALTEAGIPDDAAALANTIRDPYRRCVSLAATGSALDEAVSTFGTIVDPDGQALARQEIVMALAKAGRAHEILPLIGVVEDELQRSGILHSAASVLVDAGESSAAIGLLDDARAASDRAPLSDERDSMIQRIAKSFAEAQRFDEALATAAMAGTTTAKSHALAAVVPPLVTAGRLDQAAQIASTLSSPGARAKSLRTVATAFAENGRDGDVHGLLVTALEASHAVENMEQRRDSLAATGRLLADLGFATEAALATAEALQCGYWWHVAEALTATDDAALLALVAEVASAGYLDRPAED